MTTIEKIRAEIERRIRDANSSSERDITAYYKGRASSLEDLLSFLDTLEKSERLSTIVDFSDEVAKWIRENLNDDKTYSSVELASHFYELGKISGSSEIPNDLEEAAEKASSDAYPYKDKFREYDKDKVDEAREYFKEGFLTGAKWDKEQMLKEAVEGVVSIDISDITGREYFSVHCYEFNATGKFKDGDEVRVIIVKED